MSDLASGGMTTARWRRVGRIFEEANALEGPAREAFLDERCGDDRGLRAEVVSLLAADERAPAFLERGAVELVAPELEREEETRPVADERLGEYRLIREIGRGGMSRVYLAERVSDHLRRRVAIKRLSSPAWQREDRLRRFRAEGTVLASLSHPNIAQVFDAGVDAAGDPYLVMEHVDGETITSWCRQRAAALEERLGLFLDVCAAVGHAHRQLIVHRDLKPSNILVDRKGRVKLLDFGIAKLLDPERHGLGGESSPTRTGLLPMTPEYASPEQVSGGPITTSTDVYGLGLLLYELLTGRRPFDLKGRSASEIERIVCEEDPPRPSTGVQVQAPGTRPADEGPEGLASRKARVDADLDAIVLRAMAKEPERRYGSARELAADLRRYLEGLPVEARPPTMRYRLGKLVRRHRRAVAVAVTLGVLLAGMIAFHATRLRQERDQARREAQRAQELTGLLRDIFWGADPRRGGTGPATVDDLLERGVERVRRLDTEPLIQAELLHFLGLAHFGQGSIAEAEGLFEEALELRRRHLEAPDPKLTRSLNHLGWIRLADRDLPAASALFERALAAHRGWPGGETEDLASSLRGLALVRNGQGDHEAAEALLRRATETLHGLLGPKDPFVAAALQDLGIVLRDRGEYEGARAAFQESLEIRRAALGAEHPSVADSLRQMALVAEDRGELAAMKELLDQALSIYRRALGDDHPVTLEVARGLAAPAPASLTDEGPPAANGDRRRP